MRTPLTVLVLERGVHADVVMIAAVEQLRLLVLVRQLAVAADGALLCNMQHNTRFMLVLSPQALKLCLK